ncbi:Cdc6/Cdc18 family protein [Halorussus marinus]|uniref:Cdc6/Cdc18 family protein n=1 Tax=Halorussus marinus TaxID=2505976 RepID=UPI001091AE74|nr:Cdc6/Cdc18 family protein [Halorussus marinus]
MITDARALRPIFIPSELHHRDGEIEHLSSCLKPIQQNLSGQNTLITGPSGAGKTTLAQYTVGQLKSATLSVRSGYVNCLSDSSMSGAFHALFRDAGLGIDLSLESASTTQYLDKLRHLDEHMVVILDEVDVLADPSVIVSLWEEPHITLLMVCVDEDDFLSNADSRVSSRVRSAEKIRLQKYHSDELVDIIEARVVAGLQHGAADHSTISRIAELAAGDARLAIAFLRRAAERAQREGLDTLSPGLVEDVVDDAETDVQERNIQRLSTHQQILHDIVRENGEIAAGDLREEYEKRAQNPKSETTRRRYLQSLERYDLIEQIGATRGTYYRYSKP